MKTEEDEHGDRDPGTEPARERREERSRADRGERDRPHGARERGPGESDCCHGHHRRRQPAGSAVRHLSAPRACPQGELDRRSAETTATGIPRATARRRRVGLVRGRARVRLGRDGDERHGRPASQLEQRSTASSGRPVTTMISRARERRRGGARSAGRHGRRPRAHGGERVERDVPVVPAGAHADGGEAGRADESDTAAPEDVREGESASGSHRRVEARGARRGPATPRRPDRGRSRARRAAHRRAPSPSGGRVWPCSASERPAAAHPVRSRGSHGSRSRSAGGTPSGRRRTRARPGSRRPTRASGRAGG